MQIHAVELTDEDEFLILACDGIWEDMSSQKVPPPLPPRACTHSHMHVHGHSAAGTAAATRPMCQLFPATVRRAAIGRFQGL